MFFTEFDVFKTLHLPGCKGVWVVMGDVIDLDFCELSLYILPTMDACYSQCESIELLYLRSVHLRTFAPKISHVQILLKL